MTANSASDVDIGSRHAAQSVTYDTSADSHGILAAMVGSSFYVRVMRALGLTHRSAGELLSMSARSSQRWASGGGVLLPDKARMLATLTYPVDPELAAELAYEGRTTLEALGLVPPPAPPAPAPPSAPRFAAEDVVDSIVCAAADAMDVKPAAVRPALLAAFRRARRLGLAVQAVEDALDGAEANSS
jgi:hypothetical protein